MRRAAIWGIGLIAVTLFFFSQDITRAVAWGEPGPWWQYLVSMAIGVAMLAAPLPLVIWLGQRYPIERQFWARRFALHTAAAIVVSVAVLFAIAAADTVVGFIGPIEGLGFGDTLIFLSTISLHNHLMAYFTVIAGVHGYRYYERYQERRLHASRLEAELVRAQLATLKAQLQPHFLFNTLNAIMVLVRQQRAELAEDTLARLSDLLRCVLDDVEAQEVPLRRELEYVRLYLEIEQLRFADRLRVEIAADPDVLDAHVPHMGLQPLVENAVRHGIGGRTQAGSIAIRAARVGDTLELTVRDDGPGLRADASTSGHGIGLGNLRARLAQLYGADARLAIDDASPGVRVALTVPYRAAAPEEVHAHADR